MPPFCYALPVVLFLAFCIDRTRRKNNRIHNNEKAKTSTRKEKQKQSRSGYYIKIPKQTKRKAKEKGKSIYYTIHANKSKGKEKQIITAKQDKKTSKRDPRKAYKQTSKREKQSYTIIPCYYITVLLIYTYKHI